MKTAVIRVQAETTEKTKIELEDADFDAWLNEETEIAWNWNNTKAAETAWNDTKEETKAESAWINTKEETKAERAWINTKEETKHETEKAKRRNKRRKEESAWIGTKEETKEESASRNDWQSQASAGEPHLPSQLPENHGWKQYEPDYDPDAIGYLPVRRCFPKTRNPTHWKFESHKVKPNDFDTEIPHPIPEMIITCVHLNGVNQHYSVSDFVLNDDLRLDERAVGFVFVSVGGGKLRSLKDVQDVQANDVAVKGVVRQEHRSWLLGLQEMGLARAI